MKKQIIHGIFLFLLAAAPALRADIVTVTLTPSPDRTGAPGSTIYFGFDLFWQSDTQSLMVVNSYLVDETNPLFGNYTDTMGLNGFLNILGPSALGVSWNEAGGLSTGAGAYAINALVPIGDSNAGRLAIDYLLFDSLGGSSSGTYEVPFSVTAVPGVPEPSSLVLLGLGIAGLTGLRLKGLRARK